MDVVGEFTSRPPWRDAPEVLRSGIREVMGRGREIDALDVHGGMSPGPAAVLTFGDGRRAFVKALAEEVSPPSYRWYQREVLALRLMPAGVPAPGLLGVVEKAGWLAIVTEFAPGVVAGPPWTDESIRLVLEACKRTAVHRAADELPLFTDKVADFDGWANLASGRCGPLDDWEAPRVGRLAELVDSWRDWVVGPWICHDDLRADNAIVDLASGLAVLVDWSSCCAGASWIDPARLAADIVGAGHEHGPESALDAATQVLASVPDEGSLFLIALAGMWRYRSTLAELPSLPMLRRWQYARALALRPLLDQLSSRLS